MMGTFESHGLIVAQAIPYVVLKPTSTTTKLVATGGPNRGSAIDGYGQLRMDAALGGIDELRIRKPLRCLSGSTSEKIVSEYLGAVQRVWQAFLSRGVTA